MQAVVSSIVCNYTAGRCHVMRGEPCKYAQRGLHGPSDGANMMSVVPSDSSGLEIAVLGTRIVRQ